MIGRARAQPGPANPGAAATTRARVARILLAGMLTALVLADLRGRIVLHGQAGPLRGDGVAVGGILEASLAGLLTALLIRARRAPRDAVLAARLRAVLRPVLVTGLIVIPVVVAVATPLRVHVRPLTAPRQARSLRPRLPTSGQRHGSLAIHLPVSALLYALLVIALIGGTAACAVMLRRRQVTTASYPEAVPDADAQRTGLRAAVESASIALRTLDDARAAIIACYLSMERSLADAGAARGAADTPDELLARAVSAGLVRGAAAARLTGLFYEARFSSHQLGAEQRDAARDALRDLAADLAAQPLAAQPQAGQPQAGRHPAGPGAGQ
jgi:hypothetical protein